MTERPPITESAGVRWILTIVEPLLPLSKRRNLEREMEKRCVEQPEWCQTYLGGVLADLIQTLPDDDPWRHLNARAGNMTRGEQPPTETSATRPDGTLFGSWQDAVDVIEPLVVTGLEMDTGLCALVAEPLDPNAAAAMAFAADGWEPSRASLKEISESTLQTEPDAGSPNAKRRSGTTLYNVGTQAIRWALHRRRSYGVTDDPWPVESAWSWAWRADREAQGFSWPSDSVTTELAFERIASEQVGFAQIIPGRFGAPASDVSTPGFDDF